VIACIHKLGTSTFISRIVAGPIARQPSPAPSSAMLDSMRPRMRRHASSRHAKYSSRLEAKWR
jgi:hypothetical protein